MQRIRDNYHQITSNIMKGQIKKGMLASVDEYKKVAQRQRQIMISNNQFTNLEEVNTYIQKYTQLQRLFKQRVDKKLQYEQLVAKAQGVVAVYYNQQLTSPYQDSILIQNNPSNMIMHNPETQNISQRATSPQRTMLNQFFKQKSVNVVPDSVVRSVLQNPKPTTSGFKKKKYQAQSELARLLNQNKRLNTQIFSRQQNISRFKQLSSLHQVNSQSLRRLEQQNERLMKFNFRLKTEKGSSRGSNIQDEEFMYTPYTFFTNKNDIYQINMKNYTNSQYNKSQISSESSKPPQISPIIPIQDQHPKIPFYNKKAGQYETYTEQDYQNQKRMQYSVFDPAKSFYSQSAQFNNLNNSKRYETDRISVRNKVAFFKNQGILVKNSDLEIGYKRSQADNSDAVRVILFFNNKTRNLKPITIQYSYEQDYYEINVTQKIRQLQGGRQGREVVQVKVRGNRPDFNSVIDADTYVGQTKHRIWLPAMFFKIRKPTGKQTIQNQGSKSIYPLRPFGSPAQANKVIDNLQIINKNQAQFWCQSCKGEGLVRMVWKQDKGKLHINSNKNWVQFWSFIMLDAS